jgi:hypothetical protein
VSFLFLTRYVFDRKSIMTAGGSGFIMDVRIKTKASPEGLTGRTGSRYKISVQAPPENGKANKRLRKVLGSFFGVPASSIDIIRGHTSRDKKVLIGGAAPEACERRLYEFISSE